MRYDLLAIRHQVVSDGASRTAVPSIVQAMREQSESGDNACLDGLLPRATPGPASSH